MAKSPNDLEVERIMRMPASELLDYIMEMPEYLTDSYYSILGNAIRTRHAQFFGDKSDAKNR